MRIRLAFTSFALAVVLCAAAPAGADEVDAYVEARIRHLRIPGASLAVVHNGRVVKARGYGVANVELSVPASRDTVYEIGSNTKQFTAAAVMMLVEDGKIRLDDPLSKYFAEAPRAWEGVTIRHLLTHTSGIQNHVAVPGYMGAFKTNLAYETTPARDELLGMLFKLPLEFRPGETWAYDNSGYILLGHIVEKVTGQTYWEFLDRRIFKPLGMAATRSTDPRPIVPNRASGYEWVRNGFENRPVLMPGIGFAAGSILSSVDDLVRWDAALSSERLLKHASLEQMWTPAAAGDGSPAPVDYGYGWFLDSYRDHRVVQHSGGTPGFSSTIYRFPDDRLTIILLTNHSDRILDHLAIDIAGMYEPALRRPEGTRDPTPAITQRVREVFNALAAGNPESGALTAPMRTFLGTSTGKGFWQWYASHGELRSISLSEQEEVPGGRKLRYRVVLGENPYWLTARVTSDGRIAQLALW